MNTFTKFISIGGMAALVVTLWLASVKGWGLSSLSDPQTIKDRELNNCPEYQKDRYGNCPPRSHRRSLGSRAFYGGGGK